MNFYLKSLNDDKITDYNININFFYEDDEIKANEMSFDYLNPIFSAKEKEIYTHIHNKNETRGAFTLLVGLGKKEKLSLETIRNIGGKIARNSNNLKCETPDINVKIGKINIDEKILQKDDVIEALIQGMHLGLYTFNKYKSDNKKNKEINFYFPFYENDKNIEKIIEENINVCNSIYVARDLSNEPSSVIYPETLANNIKEKGEKAGLTVEIYEEDKLKTLGMNAMLAVGSSSRKKPRLIVIKHLKGKKNDEIIGLIGKGITCDTGGYSLKQSDSMHYQKMDMCGASNVFGAMLSLSKNKIEKNVVAVIPSCENIITDSSYKIGDIVKTMNGKTVEVLNTDAEGRLALADAITYAIKKENVDKIIDIATLTGSVGAMFGNIYTGVLTNNEDFYNEFLQTTKKTGEKMWRLPTDDAFKSMINSDVADIKNTGGCGTITAGLFLREFVEKKPWIHLDIAATSCKNPPSTDYDFKGATGVFVRTFYNFIKNYKI